MGALRFIQCFNDMRSSRHAVAHDRTFAGKIPFGIGQIKPRHFRDMARVVWENRDNLPYAWKVITQGVCDGCALGVAGLRDWTVRGPHLCMTRLNLLRLNTIGALDPGILEDIGPLKQLDNRALRALGRLSCPMLREHGRKGFRRVSWDEALARIAGKIRNADPRRIAFFLTARGITNEVYYMAQKVARFLGTNNVDNAARLCHSPSSAAMKATLGVGASTCAYRDWYGTDLVIFFGSNPANDQPVATKYLHEAKALGTKVILVNPLLEPGMKKYWVPSSTRSAIFGTEIADYWFPVTQGGDIAFLYGVLKKLFADEAVDAHFLDAHTTGYAALRAKAESLDWAEIEAGSGLSRESIEEFAALIRAARNAVLVWSMGVTQHPFGADAVQMILNLALTQGWIGREKCGVMPIRGHSSVQGGAEMGAYATALPGAKSLTPENAHTLSMQYGFEVPSWHGLTSAEMIEASARGELDLLYSLGGNFLRTLPEPEYVARALENVPVRVHQDIILTDQMFIDAKEAVIVLPAKTRYEQDDGGTETSTERRVMFSPELPRQIGEARAEWKILRDLAEAVDAGRAKILGCRTGWEMREEIARIIPIYEGIQHLREIGDAFQYGGPLLCANGVCETPDGKGHLRAVDLPKVRADGTFHVSTRRGKQFNTLIYDEVDPLTGAARDAVFMSPDDASAMHLRTGDPIALVNDVGRFEGRVFLSAIARGNLQVMWPEGNTIIPHGVRDTQGGVPDYNAHVRIERLGAS
jgi:molybdopterin-dependent oxidoreductase alpha subunit